MFHELSVEETINGNTFELINMKHKQVERIINKKKNEEGELPPQMN